MARTDLCSNNDVGAVWESERSLDQEAKPGAFGKGNL